MCTLYQSWRSLRFICSVRLKQTAAKRSLPLIRQSTLISQSGLLLGLQLSALCIRRFAHCAYQLCSRPIAIISTSTFPTFNSQENSRGLRSFILRVLITMSSTRNPRIFNNSDCALVTVRGIIYAIVRE